MCTSKLPASIIANIEKKIQVIRADVCRHSNHIIYICWKQLAYYWFLCMQKRIDQAKGLTKHMWNTKGGRRERWRTMNEDG